MTYIIILKNIFEVLLKHGKMAACSMNCDSRVQSVLNLCR